MITEENWIGFIQTFFDIKAPQEWIHHVAANWNHLKNEPGCGCKYQFWYTDPEITMCEGYQDSITSKVVTFVKAEDYDDDDDDEPYTWESFKDG